MPDTSAFSDAQLFWSIFGACSLACILAGALLALLMHQKPND